jgi:polar amino acid transport system permease protein
MILGLIIALMRLSDSFAAKLISRVYLEIIRNVPVLVLLYLTYFAVGPIFGLKPEPSAVLALTLFSASYLSEIFRAGIVSITKGQWEASYSLGFSTVDTYRDIILPQAFRRIIPPLTGQAITLIKSSALFSVVGLHDLSLETTVLASRTFMVFEAWFTAAALYLLVNIPLSTLTNWMEKRFRIVT